jgi:hypothetical protein
MEVLTTSTCWSCPALLTFYPTLVLPLSCIIFQQVHRCALRGPRHQCRARVRGFCSALLHCTHGWGSFGAWYPAKMVLNFNINQDPCIESR